jgi:putative DNA primase/helicase
MTPTYFRTRLVANGYAPIPCSGKVPILKEWQKRTETSAGDIDIWAKTCPDAPNTGILTLHTPVLDLDILDECAVDAAVELVRERFGERGKVMLRYGRRPKVAIPFRTDTTFAKIQVPLTAPDGSAGQKIELLCRGQQVVVHGIHPDTHGPYEWLDGCPADTKRDELPPITEDEAQDLVADIVMLSLNYGYQIVNETKHKGNGGEDDRVDWGYLYENIRNGRDYHDTLRDLSCKLIAAGTDGGAVVNILRDLMAQSEAPHDPRWQERYDDIPRLVDGAERWLRENEGSEAPVGEGPTEDDMDLGVVIARLAGLSLFEYEKLRKPVAEKMDIRASVLDKLVDAKRAELGLESDTDKQGKPIEFPEIEPWPEAINGAALLDEIDEAFKRHIIMSETARTISAVWPVHTYIFDRFVVTPRLCVRSAVKDSGKTSYFSVLSHVVPRVLMAASATPSSVFRTIGAYRPVLLIDEAAGMFDEAGELRRILNAGYRFDGHVLRNVGDNFEPRLFKVFAPVAFALVGKLPADLHSRCICIDLQRKLASEKIEPYRIGKMQHLDVLARKIARWANDNADAIERASPALPSSLVNRSSDLWAIILSIGTVAGGDWPRRIEQAIAASSEVGDDDSTWLEQLIRDIHSVFGKREAVASAELVASLVSMEGRPWPEMGKSRKPLTQARLARMLHGPGFCITPSQIWFQFGDTKTQLRGYEKWQFDDLFARYLPSSSLYTPSSRHSVTNADGMGTCDTSQSVTQSVTANSQSVTVSQDILQGDAASRPCDTCDTSACVTGDTSQSVTNPDEISIRDAVTLSEGKKGGKAEREGVSEGFGTSIDTSERVRSPMEMWALLDGKPVKPC